MYILIQTIQLLQINLNSVNLKIEVNQSLDVIPAMIHQLLVIIYDL